MFCYHLGFSAGLVALKTNGKPSWTMPDALKMIKVSERISVVRDGK